MDLFRLSRSYRFPYNVIQFFRRDIPRIIFILRNGFDYVDTWSMDEALAKWLIPRLRHLAEHTHGSPGGYPLSKDEQIKMVVDGLEWHEIPTDHDRWRDDILLAADRLSWWIEYSNNDRWNYATERLLIKGADKAFKWVAENIWSLWD